MKYKQLDTLDYSSEDNYLGEIFFNGQRSFAFHKANAKEGWVDTWIACGVGVLDQKFPDFLKDENGKVMGVRLHGKVEIIEFDKKGNKIEEI